MKIVTFSVSFLVPDDACGPGMTPEDVACAYMDHLHDVVMDENMFSGTDISVSYSQEWESVC